MSFSDRASFIAHSAEAVETALHGSLTRSGRASIALSGGRTPVPLYSKLSWALIDWPRVTITLTDDRIVPATSIHSNARLIRNVLLRGGAARAHLEPLREGPLNPAILPFDFVLLGMGEDGHIASLFPGAPGLQASLDGSVAPACISMRPNPLPSEAPFPRLTLTLSALLQARQILLLLLGEKKKSILDLARETGSADLPVAHIINQTGTPVTVFWAV